MKLKTLVPVTFNTGINTQESEIVEGNLIACLNSIDPILDFSFSYEYISESGHRFGSSPFKFSESQVNELYEAIKTQVPTGMSYTDSTLFLYYVGMRVQMAATFGITVEQIDIIL
jgi:hypothetical protein